MRALILIALVCMVAGCSYDNLITGQAVYHIATTTELGTTTTQPAYQCPEWCTPTINCHCNENG